MNKFKTRENRKYRRKERKRKRFTRKEHYRRELKIDRKERAESNQSYREARTVGLFEVNNDL